MNRNGEQSLRQKILLTSREMLVDEGYKHLSMRKIAGKVGVSATSIYLHFDSKDHLLHTLMEQAIDDLNTHLEQAIQGVQDPIEQLRVFGEAYLRYAVDNPQRYQIIFLVRSDKMSRYPKEKFRRARKGYEMVEQTIRKGIEEGKLQDDQPRMAAYVFWAQLHGAMSVVLSGRLDVRLDRDAFFNKALEQIIRGIGVVDSRPSVNP